MNMKNLSIIICFVLAFFTLSSEARRGRRGREGRAPKNTGVDPEIKFEIAVKKYKKLREAKMLQKEEDEMNNEYMNQVQNENNNWQNSNQYQNENVENNSWQNTNQFQNENIENSYLQKRQSYNRQEELDKANRLLLLGKHDPSLRKIYSIEDGNLIETEYIIETVDSNGNVQNNNDGKMAYKDVKTVVRTVKRTITRQPKTYGRYTKRIPFPRFPPKGMPTYGRRTRVPSDTTKKTTTIIKTTSTIRKTTTTVKTEATENSAVASGNKSSGVYQPKPGTNFQWQLTGCSNVDTKVNADVFDIDLFETPVKKIKELKDKGKKVICYFSGGTIESWRDDAEDFLKKGVVLEEMEDWEDENWVNIKSDKLKPLIQNRLDKAVQKGCDGVEIDNVDGYTFRENKFSYNDQINFNKWLANEAHKRNLSVGLKNDVDQIKELLPHFDWALNEECYEYGECDLYKPFISANKAVFGVSYLKNSDKIKKACENAKKLKIDYQIKNIDLDASRIECSSYA